MASSRCSARAFWTTFSAAACSLPCMAATSWSMVMATRSGFDGDPSLPVCAPAAADGDGNSVTWLILISPLVTPALGAAVAEGANADGNCGGASAWTGGSMADGGAGGSRAGATAVAMLADAALPPSRRFQSEGGCGTFQIFAGDSSSTPTWKSSRGLVGG